VDPARELAQLLERVRELLDGAEQHRVLVVTPGREPERERERDEPLLGAVVEVALQAPPLLVAGSHDAGA
jgi:hypothetical protein